MHIQKSGSVPRWIDVNEILQMNLRKAKAGFSSVIIQGLRPNTAPFGVLHSCNILQDTYKAIAEH